MDMNWRETRSAQAPSLVWYKAQIVDHISSVASSRSLTYMVGRHVLVAKSLVQTDAEPSYLVWNGSHHYGTIRVLESEAKKVLKTERVNGKLVPAENQARLLEEYNWMLWS